MIYLLDTCTISDFIRGDQNTITQLSAKSPKQVKVSAITAYELHYGLQKNPNLKISTRNAVLGILDDIEIISFNSSIAQVAAKIRAELEVKGQPIGAYEILIAATAMQFSYTLVTSNEKEFARVRRIKLENWRNT